MVSMKGLSRTVRTTKNFWDAFLLKVSNGKKNIAFRNGVNIELNWQEYARMRDWFEQLRDEAFTIERTNNGYYIRRKNPEFVFFTRSLKATQALFDFVLSLKSQGWTVEQNDPFLFNIKKNNVSYAVSKRDNLFSMSSEKIKILGPLDALHVYFFECENGVYDYDYNNKVVLDVGGFCGETAVFFSSRGAKKVIIYEPVLAHHEFIRKNIALNRIEAELHEEGIGEEEGSRIISYESANCVFGSLSGGKNKLKVKIKSVAKVIEESRADVGKFDCEGAETSLIKVPKEILRRINFYMIETHRPEIRRAIMDKFNRVGFKSTRTPVNLTKDISMLYFEKVP